MKLTIFLKLIPVVTIGYLIAFGVSYLIFHEPLLGLVSSILFILGFSFLCAYRYREGQVEIQLKGDYTNKEDVMTFLKEFTLFKFKDTNETITIYPSFFDRFFVSETIIEFKQNKIQLKGPKNYINRFLRRL